MILIAASTQVRGRFRRWWQVLDSNQRSLRDGLQTGATSPEATAADLLKRRHHDGPTTPPVRQTSVKREAVSAAPRRHGRRSPTRDGLAHRCSSARVRGGESQPAAASGRWCRSLSKGRYGSPALTSRRLVAEPLLKALVTDRTGATSRTSVVPLDVGSRLGV
jgi:hypothetical protein